MKGKKICVFIRSLANGGAEKQSLLLTKALKDHHDTYLFVLDKDPLLEKHLRTVEREQIQLQILEGNVLKKALAFRKFVKQHGIDVVFAHLPSDTFFSGIVGRFSGVKHLFGGLRNAWVAGHKRRAMKFMHNKVLNYSISNSHAGKTYLKDYGFKQDSFLVMPNGIEIKVKPIVRPEKKEVHIITVGRFVAQKDYLTAIRTVYQMMQQYVLPVKVKYHIVGYGEMEEQIRSWIKEYGMEAHIELHLNPPNVPELYQQADVYLCSSLFEGLSNTVMEAMTYSLPLVATDAGDNRYLIQEGKNGFVLPLSDVEGLAASLYELVSSHELRMRMGQHSYQRITSEYSYETFQRNYLQLVENL
ncbi:MAG: glycosyltransferase family 4 protein [Bacteroidota bacterium]